MRFDELELSVPDLEAARAFYAGVLQLVELPAAAGLALAAGRTRLTLRAAPPGERPRYHSAFSVPLARFDAARRLVAGHTPLITAGGDEVIVHAGWDAVAFYFRDPAGSILECIARRGDLADDDAALAAPAIASVCEVGLVLAMYRRWRPCSARRSAWHRSAAPRARRSPPSATIRVCSSSCSAGASGTRALAWRPRRLRSSSP